MVFDCIMESLFSSIQQSISIFTSRMETHCGEIFRNGIVIPDISTDNESLSGTPIEIYQQNKNYLQEVVKNLQVEMENISTSTRLLVNQNKELIQTKHAEFQQYYMDMVMKKLVDMNNVFTASKLFTKSLLLNQCPLNWEDCKAILNNSPNICLQNLIKTFHMVPTDQEEFKHLFERLETKQQVILQHSAIEKNLKDQQGKLHKCIHFVYQKAHAAIKQSSSICNDEMVLKQATSKSVDMSFDFNKQMYHYKYLLTVTNEFIQKICSDKEKQRDETFKQSIANYNKNLKSSLNLVKEDVTKEFKESIKNEFDDLLDRCMNYYQLFGDIKDNQVKDIFLFDQEEVYNSIYNIGSTNHSLEVALEYAVNFYKQNICFIEELLNEKMIDRNMVLLLFKDLSFILSADELQKLFENVQPNVSYKDILTFSMEQQELQSSVPPTQHNLGNVKKQ